MDKELCFNIENDNLYLEQVLVDYADIPIYFICRGSRSYYLALCIDVENYNYAVVEMSIFDVFDLLHGNVTMRDAIMKHREYWQVISGEDVASDNVTKCFAGNIDDSLLPEKGAYFQILTKDMEVFVNRIDEKLMLQKQFIPISKLGTGDKAEISNNVDLIDYKLKIAHSSFDAYNEKMDYIDMASYSNMNLGIYFEFSVNQNNILAA